MTSSSDNKMWILTHTNSDRGSCCTVGSLVPRRPRLCPDINHLSVFCFSLPFSKVGMILMTSTCEALGNQVPPAVGQNSSKTEWSTPLSQLREERNPSCIVFCAESTSKAVAGTHNRGQFTMDCAVHSHNAGHRRSPRSHTPPAESQPGGAGQVERQKRGRQSQPCSTQDEKERERERVCLDL